MTLIGLDSRSEEFDNLTLTVGMGTKLTLQDVRITGDKTLLSLAGGNTLTLLGENRLIGCADASGNACPTVISGGDLTICGSGSLKLQALVNNAAFMGAETSKISIGNCLISVFKSDKLGFDGGAFCANAFPTRQSRPEAYAVPYRIANLPGLVNYRTMQGLPPQALPPVGVSGKSRKTLKCCFPWFSFL